MKMTTETKIYLNAYADFSFCLTQNVPYRMILLTHIWNVLKNIFELLENYLLQKRPLMEKNICKTNVAVKGIMRH